MRRSRRMPVLKDWQAYIAVMAILTLLLIHTLQDKEFFYIVAQVFSILHVSSSSYGKIIAFYAIAVSIFFFMFLKSKFQLKVNSNFKNYIFAVIVLVVVVVVMNLINTLVFMKYSNMLYNYFSQKQNLTYTNFTKSLVLSWISFEGESTHYYTIDVMTHSHQSKSVIFFFLKTLGLQKAVAADIGEGVYAFHQEELSYFLLLSVISFIVIIYFVKNYIALLERKEGFLAQKIILLFALIVVLFQYIHSLYDGGLFITFWLDSIVGLVTITFLLAHYLTENKRYLYIPILVLFAYPYIIELLKIFLFYLFKIEPLFPPNFTSPIKQMNSFLIVSYILAMVLKYKKKEIWMREYFLPVILAGSLFAIIHPYTSANWSIFDAITLSHKHGTYSYEGNNPHLIEVTTFKDFKAPENFPSRPFQVGNNGLKVTYFQIDNRTSKYHLKQMLGDLDSPIRSFNTTFKNYTYNFYVLYDNPINGSYVLSEERIDNMYLVRLNATTEPFPKPLISYLLGKKTNKRAIIVDFTRK